MYRLLLFLLLMLPATHFAQGQIGLASYREAVLRHSYPLQAARAHTSEMAAREAVAESNLLPRLSLSGNFNYALRHEEGIKPWNFSLQPEITAPLYEGGRLRATLRGAVLESSASREEEISTELEIRHAADYAYWNLSAKEEFLKAQRRYVEIIGSLKRVIDERFREGYIARGDLLMIEARLSTANYELLVTEQQFEEALHNFNILRGMPSDQSVTLAESILDSLPLPQRLGFEKILDARPDFRSARLRSEIARNHIRIERSNYNPQLHLGVRGVWQPQAPNRRGTTSLDGELLARLSVPIFGWSARRRTLDATRAAALRVEWQQAELYEEILREERNGWSAVVESHAQIATVSESLRIAGENLDLGTYSYSEGLTTILEVLQTQLNWIQIYTNAITAHFNYAVACSNYRRITGEQGDAKYALSNRK